MNRVGISRFFKQKIGTKIGDGMSMIASKAGVFPGNWRSAFCSSRGSSWRICMRLAFPEQPRFDCPPVAAVPLNLNCRDEIIPILRALQHIYEQTQVRRQLLDLIGKDVN